MGDAIARRIIGALTASGVRFHPTPFSSELRTVVHVASALGLPPSRIAKALLVRIGDEPPAVVVLPGDRQLDTDLLARRLGGSRVRLVARADVRPLAGVEPGAVTPFLTLIDPSLRVLVDASMLGMDMINVSSGSPTLGLTLAAHDMATVTAATPVDLSHHLADG